MLYRIIRLLIKLGINLYYSEIKVRDQNLLNHDGPMIIIANHPNTLIDAWLIGIISPKPIYYMTKGTFFNSKWKMKILRSLNMIPVNRATEAKTAGVDNNATLEECNRLLLEGKTLVIFPEGNSLMELFLRQLKSGTARIALEAESRKEGKLNLKVVPVGLIYTEGNKFRSSILVNCGEGTPVTDYLEEYQENSSLAARKLTDKFREMLEGVLVTTQSKEQEEIVNNLNTALHSRYLDHSNDVESEVEMMKSIRDRVQYLGLQNPSRLELILQMSSNLHWKVELMDIKNDFLDRGIRFKMFIRQMITSIIGIILGFPLYLFGLIHNVIQFKFTDFIVPKITNSKEFYAPLAILIGLLIYPLFYILFSFLVYHFIPMHPILFVAYCVCMPVLGMFAYWYANYFKHTWYKLNYIFLIMRDREVVERMKSQRKRIFELLFEDN